MSTDTLSRADDPALETAAPEDVREATLAGARWGVVARVGIETATFTSSIALARLVSPVAFGHAAVALAVTALASSLVVEGFGTPLVQRKLVDREHVEVGLLLSVLMGVALTGICIAVSPAIAGLVGERTAALVRLASPVFVLVSIAVIPEALQQRRMNFRVVSLIDLASLVVGVVASIGLAALGLGDKALVIGQLAIPACAAAIYLFQMPRVLPRWHRRHARDITGFGVQTTASSLLFSAYANIDYVVVGAQLGPLATGYYWRAFQIGGTYQSKISQIMLRLALPVYSRTADLADMRRVRRRIVRMHATVIFPLLALYIVVAPVLVPIVFGTSWRPTIIPSQILAVTGMVFALGTGTPALVVAAGYPRPVLYSNVVNTVIYAADVIAFARFGLTALCVSIVAVNALYYLGSYYVLVNRIVGIPMSDLWHEIAPATLSLAPLFAAGLLAYSIPGLGGLPLLRVAAALVAGSLAYIVSLRGVFPATWGDLSLVARRVLGRSKAPAVVAS